MGLLKHADYVAGTNEALDAVRKFISGAELELTSNNTDEIISRLGRDTRAGLWTVVCTIGSPSDSYPGLLRAAEKHFEKVEIQQGIG